MQKTQIQIAVYIFLWVSNINCQDFNKAKPIDIVHNIVVNNSLNYNHLLLDSIIKDVHLISLKCNDQFTIKEIDKILEFKKQFYILDRFQSQGVFVFDSLGNFLMKVGSIGKKPGQYMYPLDIVVDSLKNELLILNSDFGTINIYDLSTGSFKSSLNNPGPATRFSKINTGEWWIAGGNSQFELTLTSANLTKEIQFLPKRNGRLKMPHQTFLHVGDSLDLFICNYSDTVYRFSDNKVFPYVWLNFGDDAVTYKESIEQVDSADITKQFSARKIFYRYYFQNSSHIYFTYIKERKLHGVIYDTKKNTSISFPCENVTDNLLFNNNFPVIVGNDNSGNFIATSTSFLLNNAIKDGESSLRFVTNKEVIDTSKLSQTLCPNPILISFKFK